MATSVEWPGWPTVWTPFVQGGEDTIHVIAEAPLGSSPRVGLSTTQNITWMKRIRVLDGHGTEMATLTTQDSEHGPIYVQLPQGWRTLEFVKAKFLGIPTGMYQTPPPGQLLITPVDLPPGWTLHFAWSKD